jgi:hypothetical protein
MGLAGVPPAGLRPRYRWRHQAVAGAVRFVVARTLLVGEAGGSSGRVIKRQPLDRDLLSEFEPAPRFEALDFLSNVLGDERVAVLDAVDRVDSRRPRHLRVLNAKRGSRVFCLDHRRLRRSVQPVETRTKHSPSRSMRPIRPSTASSMRTTSSMSARSSAATNPSQRTNSP